MWICVATEMQEQDIVAVYQRYMLINMSECIFNVYALFKLSHILTIFLYFSTGSTVSLQFFLPFTLGLILKFYYIHVDGDVITYNRCIDGSSTRPFMIWLL